MDPHASIFAPLPEIEGELERVLGACLPWDAAQGELRRAMMYSTLGAGKRLRPVLAWHCCEAASQGQLSGRMSLPVGVGVELVHCFSLVHDDLPALDNDDLRRGKPTLHKHAGEAMAILAGDALLSLAFEVLCAEDVARRGPQVQVALVRELARATSHMIQGQVWDTCAGAKPIEQTATVTPTSPERTLYAIHSGKTGALIAASCRMGAMIGLGEVREEALRPIDTYAQALGVLFQAVDDLLDVTQSAEHTGKRTNKDAQAGKLTYPALYGVEGTRRRVEQLREQARSALAPLGSWAGALHHTADFLAARTK